MITAVKAGLCAGYAGQDQLFGEQQPFLCDIVSDRVAGFLFELPHHVVFADVEMPGQCINGQIAVQMFIDVLKDLDDLGIAIVRINEFQMVFCSSAVQMDHKFQKQYLPLQFCGIPIVKK